MKTYLCVATAQYSEAAMMSFYIHCMDGWYKFDPKKKDCLKGISPGKIVHFAGKNDAIGGIFHINYDIPYYEGDSTIKTFNLITEEHLAKYLAEGIDIQADEIISQEDFISMGEYIVAAGVTVSCDFQPKTVDWYVLNEHRLWNKVDEEGNMPAYKPIIAARNGKPRHLPAMFLDVNECKEELNRLHLLDYIGRDVIEEPEVIYIIHPDTFKMMMKDVGMRNLVLNIPSSHPRPVQITKEVIYNGN